MKYTVLITDIGDIDITIRVLIKVGARNIRQIFRKTCGSYCISMRLPYVGLQFEVDNPVVQDRVAEICNKLYDAGHVTGWYCG